MSNLARAIISASGGGSEKFYVAIPHENDSSSNNLSFYELDSSGSLTLLDQIRCQSGNSATYATSCAFHPDPTGYGKYLAVTTNQGYSIIDYSDDTNLTEVDTGGNSSKAERGVAYNATGSKVFFSGGNSTLTRYDQASDGTLSNETTSGSLGGSDSINAVAVAKTKDVGIVVFNKGSAAAVGAATFAPSDFALDDTIVTKSEEVYQVDISSDGTYAVFAGKDYTVHPKTGVGRLNIDSSNNLTESTQVIAGSAPQGVRIAEGDGYVAVGGNYSSGNKLRLYYSSMFEATSVDPGGNNPHLVWAGDGDFLVSMVNATNIKVYSWNGGTGLTLTQTISSSIPYIRNSQRMDSITA